MRYYWERLKEHIENLMGTHWEQTKNRIFGYDICTSRMITWKAKKKEKKKKVSTWHWIQIIFVTHV
jgi:hypothetical protein